MRVVIAGGSGQIGTVLAHEYYSRGYDVSILSRTAMSQGPWRTVGWDAATLGDWTTALNGADVLVNMAGRNVNCRYTPANRREIMESRLNSTRLLGIAIQSVARPPRIWLQSSTATIYAHRFDAPNDEATGIIGGRENDAPAKWRFSIDVAAAWEAECNRADTPDTRKVLLRSAMIMSPDSGGVFDTLLSLARRGLGGPAGNGKQYVSWVHDRDFINALDFLVEREDLSGAFNVASPNPLPNAAFMRELRLAAGVRAGLPATALMLEAGAFFMRSETELILKSRRVVPGRLIDAGFNFMFPLWRKAAVDLCARRSAIRS